MNTAGKKGRNQVTSQAPETRYDLQRQPPDTPDTTHLEAHGISAPNTQLCSTHDYSQRKPTTHTYTHNTRLHTTHTYTQHTPTHNTYLYTQHTPTHDTHLHTTHAYI